MGSEAVTYALVEQLELSVLPINRYSHGITRSEVKPSTTPECTFAIYRLIDYIQWLNWRTYEIGRPGHRGTS